MLTAEKIGGDETLTRREGGKGMGKRKEMGRIRLRARTLCPSASIDHGAATAYQLIPARLQATLALYSRPVTPVTHL